jgi:prepilin-type N-terminal cleavage/methylation domain-containing protein
MPRPRAFTLVELLVVISIIVVLLSLLTPTLDRAIYQAELSLCGAQQRSLGYGAVAYGGDFSRRYPYRAGVRSAVLWQPYKLYEPVNPLSGTTTAIDERLPLKAYVVFAQMLDPLCEAVDLAPEATTNRAAVVGSSYQLYYDWSWNGHRGMQKIGDRFAWNGDRFSVLVSDWDRNGGNNVVVNSHPDYESRLRNFVWNNENNYYLSVWRLENAITRPPVDKNVCTDDLAVRRYDRVELEALGGSDPRMRSVPDFQTAGGYISYIPPQ